VTDGSRVPHQYKSPAITGTFQFTSSVSVRAREAARYREMGMRAEKRERQ
jgi:hypothetical protein